MRLKYRIKLLTSKEYITEFKNTSYWNQNCYDAILKEEKRKRKKRK